MARHAPQQPSDVGMTRRVFIQGLLAKVGIAAAGGALAVEGIRFLDSFSTSPYFTPQGSSTRDTLDWAADLFGDVRYSMALPGRANVDFGGGEIHPDILRPYEELAGLLHRSGIDMVPVAIDRLPTATLDEQLLLIGGPVSNAVARAWQGYRQNPESKIYEFVGSPVSRRWRFEYALDRATAPKPMRFVAGILKESWPQAIWDERSPGSLQFAALDHSTGLLVEDKLLLTFAPNPFSKSGTMMLDVSDLHGQGNEAFVQLLSNKNRLQALTDELHRQNIPLGTPFQALYSVFVEHDHDARVTRFRDLSTPEVEPLARA